MTKPNLYPLERLMLLHLRRFGDFPADMAEAAGVFGVYTSGHRKWPDARNCMAIIALEGLERHGLVIWSGQSRALGHRGWYGGLWRLTDGGKALAEEIGAQS